MGCCRGALEPSRRETIPKQGAKKRMRSQGRSEAERMQIESRSERNGLGDVEDPPASASPGLQAGRAAGWGLHCEERGVNHCLLEVEVIEAPQIRYTQDNQTPIAEMLVRIDGLRPDDPPGQLKVVGWGNLAQDLQNRVHSGQRLVLEGRMRINSIARPDGVREKRAELTLSRLHPFSGAGAATAPAPAAAMAPPLLERAAPASVNAMAAPPPPPVWNSSPLVPSDDLVGDDDIPF